ncbi:MAG: DUF4422 domain-containing protein [Eggerthellaceae bacterium]|nr:DUF4422 domain-containing protein [Eggerthellaceae bacterium]
MPRFSIIIPSYGNAAYIADCLGSLQSQSFDDWEAIVVDDASPDGSSRIVSGLAKKDHRIKQYLNETNRGRHISRVKGVEHAIGDYVLFLDSDDEFESGFLGELSLVLPSDSQTIVHFGIRVIGESEGLENRAGAFESHANRAFPDLISTDISKTVFDASCGFVRDWRITQRAFPLLMAKRAFSLMSRERLEMAEDGYEYFVLSSIAHREVTHNELVGYRYYLGRGGISEELLDAAAFESLAGEYKRSFEAALRYSNGFDLKDMRRQGEGFRLKLIEALSNDWHERVSKREKIAAAIEMVKAIGPEAVAAHMMRFVRDDAYDMIERGLVPERLSEIRSWKAFADELASNAKAGINNYRLYAAAAQEYLNQLEAEFNLVSNARKDIRIFVCTHKDSSYFDSDILQPIQVGTALSPHRLSSVLHDDEGDNISCLNPMYCELTAQYWAWKNVDAEYYGFCHYRRYFDFSATRHDENAYGEILEKYIDKSTQKKYRLDDASIEHLVRQFDVITTEFKDLNKFPGDVGTPRKQYHEALHLADDDLETIVNILKEMHPEYAQDADAFLDGGRACFCNMFIMRKEIFFNYCAWLFPLLEEFAKRTDMTHYDKEALRTPGHLSERLFNIYYQHHLRVGAGWKTTQLQCVRFTNPDRVHPLLPPFDSGFAPMVPVVFAADGDYVPMLSATIRSLLDNASPYYYYDIVVLERGISASDQRVMRETFAKPGRVSISFYNVSRIVDSFDLSTNNEHISIETYYRFLVQELLPYYDKVIYLDSDLIVRGDISQLYETELGDNLLAAVRDLDFLGNVNMKDGGRKEYAKTILGMKDPYAYFQAGVLVLNTAALRSFRKVEDWLKIAANSHFIYDDQDILNAECEGRVQFLDYRWNVMTDCADRIARVFSFAPAEAYSAYLASRADQLITHYAGFEKPWKLAGCDESTLFWSYARKIPFYERLVALLCGQEPEGDCDEHDFAIDENNPIRRLIDPIMPYGSRRREVVKSAVRKMRGRK